MSQDNNMTLWNQLFQGEIVNCYRRYFQNNDRSSSFMCGTLKYMTQTNEIKTIEYCTRQTNLIMGDIVTFNFSADDQALHPYANNVNKRDFNSAMDEHDPDIDVDTLMDTRTRNTRKSRKKNSKPLPVRLICISDTHNSHNKLTKQLTEMYESEADILIHCGDMTDSGSKKELQAVNTWFGTLPYKHIIAVAGNMDGIGLDTKGTCGGYGYGSYGYGYGDESDIDGKSIFTNAVYLEHESYYLKKYNLRFFGSPYSMRFVGGFQVNSDKQADTLWSSVPSNTDILICHGPPQNILDVTSRGKRTGDKVLYNHVINRIQPKIMCFGHMHSSFGYKQSKGIHFYNCALNNALHGHGASSSRYDSNKRNRNMANEKPQPHIIDLSELL